MDAKRLLKKYIMFVLAALVLVALVTVVFDPFYHYHKPIANMKAVLNQKEYQCIGTIHNFDYDALIVGSSVCENYNNKWFDQAFGCKSLKAVRSYGGTADLTYFINEAYKNHELKYVFYNVDPGNLAACPELTFESTGCPMYLYDENPLNDIEYLLNKDVLFESIPYMLAKGYSSDYDEGESYNWGRWKEFNQDMILGLYIRKKNIEPMKDSKIYEDECLANIELLIKLIENHPETEYVIFIPPYSCVWWDNIYRYGDTESYLYNMKLLMEKLVQYDNVKMYYFLNDTEIVTNLDNYMDVLHFSPQINQYVTEELMKEDRIIKYDDIEVIINDSRNLSYQTINEILVEYDDVIKVDIYD